VTIDRWNHFNYKTIITRTCPWYWHLFSRCR